MIDGGQTADMYTAQSLRASSSPCPCPSQFKRSSGLLSMLMLLLSLLSLFFVLSVRILTTASESSLAISQRKNSKFWKKRRDNDDDDDDDVALSLSSKLLLREVLNESFSIVRNLFVGNRISYMVEESYIKISSTNL